MERLEDIKQPDDNGRSIRRIQIEKEKPRMILNDRRPPGLRRDRKISRWGMWFTVVLAVIVLFFAISVVFTGATVRVYPKKADLSVNGEFKAFEEGVLEGDLVYDVMTIEKEISKEVPASGEEKVEEKADGKIVVFNDYSGSPEKLIANTRFETPEGLIYRIKGAITVPGRKETGGEIIPGQLEVTVYADEAGKKYNIGLSDFTVPGLKGDPRFDKIYARSKTAMEGGFSGVIPKPSEADVLSARSEMENTLRTELLSEANSVKPEGFILFDKAYALSFSERIENSDEAGKAKIVLKGVLAGYIFDEKNIAGHLAKSLVVGYDGKEVLLESEENLVFETEEDLSTPESLEEFDFSLSGGVKIVWAYDTLEFKNSLKGTKRGELDSILSHFGGIERAETTIRPFWKRSMPDDISDIKIQRIVE